MFLMDFERFPNVVLSDSLYNFAIFSVLFGCDNYKDRAQKKDTSMRNLLSKPHAVLRYGALSERYRFESVVTVDYATATLKV